MAGCEGIYRVFVSVVGILLFFAGVTDIRKRQISRGYLLLFFPVCFAALVFQQNKALYDVLGGLAVGMCVLGISMASREQIGRGDGFVLTAIGPMLGFCGCLAAVCVASLIMSVAAMILLVCKKGNRHTKLPFLPAVFVGYLLCTMEVLI